MAAIWKISFYESISCKCSKSYNKRGRTLGRVEYMYLWSHTWSHFAVSCNTTRPTFTLPGMSSLPQISSFKHYQISKSYLLEIEKQPKWHPVWISVLPMTRFPWTSQKFQVGSLQLKIHIKLNFQRRFLSVVSKLSIAIIHYMGTWYESLPLKSFLFEVLITRLTWP